MKETRFKDTEVGRIPVDWEVKKLGQVDIKNGSMLKSSEYQFGIFPVIAGGKKPAGYHSVANRKGNTITISGSGANAGYVAFYSEPIFASDCSTINEQKGVDVKFLYYVLTLKQNDIYRCQAGGAQPHIHAKDIKDIFFYIPQSSEEQRRIATALTNIDELISSLDKLIAKKKDIKQGAMQQLLTGKIRLKGFTEPWVENSIDELFDLGNGYTPSKSNPAYWTNGNIPWFRMEDIRTNGRILKDSIQHITPEAIKGGGLFPAFSIILSTTATIGEHALLIADSLANQRFTFLLRKVNRKNMIDIMFFFYHCFILGEWCRSNINDGGLLAVNMNDLKNYTFSYPSSIEEQRAIASILTDMDNELAVLEAKRSKYAMLKDGMMQQLLTGKIRLTD